MWAQILEVWPVVMGLITLTGGSVGYAVRAEARRGVQSERITVLETNYKNVEKNITEIKESVLRQEEKLDRVIERRLK